MQVLLSMLEVEREAREEVALQRSKSTGGQGEKDQCIQEVVC